MSTMLDAIAAGATRSVAAGLAGIGEETLREWAKQDTQFAALIREAESRKTWRRISALEAASERGDTTATKLLLERDPASRAEFGPPGLGSPGDGGPGVILNIHFQTGAGAILNLPAVSPARVIDHAPAVPTEHLTSEEK